MARWLVVLVLTFAVGFGFVSDGMERDCVADECAGEEHGDEQDVGMGAPGGDECPPFCGGCARVPAQVTPSVALAHVNLRVEHLALSPPPTPLSAPPLNGLFRPPRA